MIKLLVLILVAIIVMQCVEVLKGVKNWFINKDWKKGKYGIPFAVSIGLIAGLTLQIGITSAIMGAMGLEYTFPTYFIYFDIGATCLFLSKGSGIFIDTLEKFSQSKKDIEQIRTSDGQAPSNIEFDEIEI